MARKRRRRHIIRIDIGSKRGLLDRLCFRYRSSEIAVTLYKNGASARYFVQSVPKQHSFDQWKNEIVKKALLLLLVETGHCDERYKASLYFDGKREAVEFFYFLKESKCSRLNDESRQELKSVVKKRTRSNYPPSVVCYQNYALGSTGKSFDRFRYLFQGLDTFYENYFRRNEPELRRHYGMKPKERFLEQKKIAAVADAYYSSRISLPDRTEGMDGILKLIDFSTDDSAILSIRRALKSAKVNAHVEAADVKAWLLRYAYYLRCKFFHGEAALPLVVPRGDVELNNVDRCNELISSLLRDDLLKDLIHWDYQSLGDATSQQEA